MPARKPLLALAGTLMLSATLAACNQQTPPNPTGVQVPQPPPSKSSPVPGNFNFAAEAVERDGPAVVRIDASRVVNQDPFGRMFGLPSGERVQRGSGSGFIFRADGLVLTNAHVVQGADRVTVKLKNGTTYEGKVLGSDPVTDVAVVRISAAKLPTVRLGNSDSVRPGEWAIAIGNPLGLDNTVTVGIVSAVGRTGAEVGIPDKRVPFIQTDAAINPGNSGGPLLNALGEVIGINTAIRADGQGIGFAVPINTAVRIADQILRTGRASHPLLGVQMVSLTPEGARELNANPNSPVRLPEQKGALVVRLMPNGPAAQAGLRPGDLITAAGGKPVEGADQLQRIVESGQVGDRLNLTVVREGQTRQVVVRLGEMNNGN
jgi:S1-C subfamily serine protease